MSSPSDRSQDTDEKTCKDENSIHSNAAAGDEERPKSRPPRYPSRGRLIIWTIGMMSSAFLVALDNYILATAIPRIASDFDSLSDVGWYASAYFLTQMALQPVFGQLFNLCSEKLAYLLAIAVFEIGSIISATAPNSLALIIGRLILGAGGAGIYVGVLVFLGHAVHVKHRPALLSIVTSVFGVASVIGPLLGGVFTDSPRLTWRFCFWLNIPIGSVALLLVAFFFNLPEPPVKPAMTLLELFRRTDPLGTVLLIGGFVCLLLALQWATIVFPWSDPRVWGCLFGSVLLLGFFVGLEIHRGESASIRLNLFKQRTVAAASSFLLFIQMAIGVLISYLPLYFQAVKGISAKDSGILNLPYLTSLLFAPMLSGAIVSAWGYYVPIMIFGATLATVGSGLLTSVTISSSEGMYIGYQILAGLGAGLTNQISYTAVQHVLPSEQMVLGSALVSFCNSLGPILGISIAQVVFASVFLQRISADASLDFGVVIHSGPTALATAVPPELLETAREAYGYALTKAFIIPVLAAGLALICSLLVEHKNLKR